MEITKDKVTEIFCIIDDFCKEYDSEICKHAISESNGRKHRRRGWTMSRSEIMAVLIYFHFNTFRNFKHYYLFYVQIHMRDLFPKQLSYNRFIELVPRVAVEMMLFIQLFCFGRCTGISFVDSTCIPVCHNKPILHNTDYIKSIINDICFGIRHWNKDLMVKRANLRSNCLVPVFLNSTVAFVFSPVPSMRITVPMPKR